MEPYNRFFPKKAGAVPCDLHKKQECVFVLQSNVGVDPVVIGHIAAAQVV